jgi:site-specific recombinase XerD
MARAKHGKLTDKYVASLTPLVGPKGKPLERIVRDGAVPGFLIRVGGRKRSFALRIEAKPKAISKHLGDWPALRADDARAMAADLWQRHKAGEDVLGGHVRDGVTLATVWPLYKQRMEERGRSMRTIEGYSYDLARLGEGVLNRPLRELGLDPTIMEREYDRIRKEHGPTTGAATARAVRAIFRFQQRRDPTLIGNPVGAVDTAVKKRRDLPVMAAERLPGWFKEVKALNNPLRREMHLFTLLSGVRTDNLISMEWENLIRPIKHNRLYRFRKAKGGEERAFDLILTKPMLRCLWRARRWGRILHPERAQRWIWPSGSGMTGHMQGPTKDGLSCAGHGLRRTYSTLGADIGVDEHTIGKLLNHEGQSITSHYIRMSALGRLLPASQETISGYLMESLGSGAERWLVQQLELAGHSGQTQHLQAA